MRLQYDSDAIAKNAMRLHDYIGRLFKLLQGGAMRLQYDSDAIVKNNQGHYKTTV
jgi:hypothetical protein